MIPSLFTFTVLAAAVFLLIGLPLVLAPKRAGAALMAFPRSQILGIVFMVLGGGWFLWKISQLGEADFGDYKVLLFALFAATLIGSLIFVKDFLAVRGLAVLALLSANVGLKAAFGHYDIPARLVLVTILYGIIIVAITWGVAPYYARNTITWFNHSNIRLRAGGLLLAACGSALLISAVFIKI